MAPDKVLFVQKSLCLYERFAAHEAQQAKLPRSAHTAAPVSVLKHPTAPPGIFIRVPGGSFRLLRKVAEHARCHDHVSTGMLTNKGAPEKIILTFCFYMHVESVRNAFWNSATKFSALG